MRTIEYYIYLDYTKDDCIYEFSVPFTQTSQIAIDIVLNWPD